MKSIKKIPVFKNTVLLLSLTMLLYSVLSCSKKVSFQISSVVPAARGQVKIKKDNNHNYAIQVHLYNLAEVKRLQPAKESYVIWLVTKDGVTKNIGQIKSSTSTLSNRLKASFQTVSSFKPVRVFVTAEDQSDVQYPGTMTVISTNEF